MNFLQQIEELYKNNDVVTHVRQGCVSVKLDTLRWGGPETRPGLRVYIDGELISTFESIDLFTRYALKHANMYERALMSLEEI